MRMRTLFILAAVWLSVTSRGGCEEFQAADWSFMAPVDLGTWPGKGLVELEVPPGVADRCKSDLSDLRVVSEPGGPMGFTIVLARPVTRKPREEMNLTGKLYNRSHVPGKESTVIVDFGARVLKKRVKIATPGTNFRRRVRLEASDDSEKWTVIRDGAFLFRVDPGEKVPAYDKSVVDIPENDQRYLRITVFNSEDDKDAVDITQVAAAAVIKPLTPVEPEPGTAPVRFALPGGTDLSASRQDGKPAPQGQPMEVTQRNRATEVVLDLGFRNTPLYGLRLNVGDFNPGSGSGAGFFRRVEVSGRDRKTQVIYRPVEDSKAHEKTVEVPWSTISSDAVYCYSAGQDSDQSVDIPLNGASPRYLRLVIYNGDDPPLDIKGVDVFRVIRYVVFAPRQGQAYSLVFDNPKAAKPVYDIGHYLDVLRKDGVTKARLLEVKPNPAHKPVEKAVPWSEKHKSIIWVALLAMGAVLALLVYRLAKSAPQPGA